MAKASLVEQDIKAGESLVKALDEARFRTSAALWLYFSEPSEWRIIVASPEVDERGPIRAYTRLQSILAKASLAIPLGDISLVSPRTDVIRRLRRAIRTPRGVSISHIRLRGATVDSVFIEDAHIYRMK